MNKIKACLARSLWYCFDPVYRKGIWLRLWSGALSVQLPSATVNAGWSCTRWAHVTGTWRQDLLESMPSWSSSTTPRITSFTVSVIDFAVSFFLVRMSKPIASACSSIRWRLNHGARSRSEANVPVGMTRGAVQTNPCLCPFCLPFGQMKCSVVPVHFTMLDLCTCAMRTQPATCR